MHGEFLQKQRSWIALGFVFKVWVTIDLLRYCYQICMEICDHLHIELFRIPYPGGPVRSAPSTSTAVSEKNGTNNKSVKARSRKYYQ